MDFVNVDGYSAEKLQSTGKNLNKWVIRIGAVGEFNRSMYQWDLEYKARGEHPRKIRSKRDGEDVPFSIVEKAFLMLFENKTYDNKKESVRSKVSTNQDNKSDITNIPSGTNNATRNSHITSGTKCTTRNDILLAIVNNCNGDKDVLMRVMDMLESSDDTSDSNCDNSVISSDNTNSSNTISDVTSSNNTSTSTVVSIPTATVISSDAASTSGDIDIDGGIIDKDSILGIENSEETLEVIHDDDDDQSADVIKPRRVRGARE